ncbi:hypothetical protein [Microvirga sp. 17 mud 1-3]|uniref:hypothetical protein n=1 Tax=Microvirga sp. 17 mud 1-3 TaxID=2082949 RepID=UPI0013A540D9|nr:hypothetical protein [Microvirga sp. 17 mud 1-3]
MKQITLSLVWLTIRIDIIPTALARRPVFPTNRSDPTPEMLESLRARLSSHLLRDIGLKRDRQE